MPFQVLSSPHDHPARPVNRLMLQVLLALIPAIAIITWFFGFGLLINLTLASATALLAEAAVLRLRRRPVRPALFDLSALVSAWLLAIAVPTILPWWMVVLGSLFAIVVVKQLYGGLGYNPFNPAMAGYLLLLISYPMEMTQRLSPSIPREHMPDLLQSLHISFLRVIPPGTTWDALTGATPLDELRTKLAMGLRVDQIHSGSFWGHLTGQPWEWVSLALFISGLWLIYRRVISWHIPLAFLGSLSALAFLFFLLDPQRYPVGFFHLVSGGTMLGAFFIATDPVTASTTPLGRLIYAAAIGVIVFAIRSWGGYPDAVAFAVVLMNMAVPMIDHYTQPRVTGHKRRLGP
ncbi:MAG: electron transport complex subunit RsxD [Gammaproteobacteria bacterium SHHR-1]